ncbi:potassium channel protein [Anoxybacillus sp. PDR2]|jgi:voltage-gated potassium channel|nr:ion transporter [Anoxybacillus sp. UARK-01]QHC05182.1 potassium channel protein [Anoxybacillus sp. PDR2]
MKEETMKYAYFRLPIFVRMLLVGFSFILLFGGLIHAAEPNTYRTLFDGIWWAIVTAATVGYGDFVPKTMLGKFLGIALILFGTGFISAYFAALSASAISRENALLHGNVAYTKEGHVVVVGWNERVRELLKQLTAAHPSFTFVIVDATLDVLPVSYNQVHFIKGNPTYDSILQKANVAKAKMIVITADQHKNELDADMASILTLLSAKGINPDIYAIIEILTTQQVNNAKLAGADEIIQTNQLSSFSIINSLQSPGISPLIEQLLYRLGENCFQFLDPPDELVGQTMAESSRILLNQQILLIGIIREGVPFMNPSPLFTIQQSDRLFVLKHH